MPLTIWNLCFVINLTMDGNLAVTLATIPVNFPKFSWGRQRANRHFWPIFLRLSARGKSLGISMGETFFLLTIRLRHNNKEHSFQELLTV